MSLLGAGAIAIWHDIAPEGRAEFYAWHGNEHMRERVGIPGFLRGRRYVVVAGAPEYFNLYETESLATATGNAYLERLNHPTPWTIATVPHFRRVARSICNVVASFGRGQGGLIGTFRYSISESRFAEHRQSMCAKVLPTLADRQGVAGCHLLIADADASAVKTAERSVRHDDNAIPPWILLVESWGDQAGLDLLCRSLLTNGTFDAASAPPVLAIYQLQNAVDPKDVA